MAEDSKIEWCDHTFNPWEGCTKVGPGCDHCYAEARNHRFGGGNWGPGAPRRRTSEANWKKPLKWSREAGADELSAKHILSDEKATRESKDWARNYRRPRVFCASLADVFDNEVPVHWRTDLLNLIHQTPNLDWLLLTKRIGKVNDAIYQSKRRVNVYQQGESFFYWLKDWHSGKPPKNVWLGATVVNQAEADRDIPKLLEVPAAVRFLSMEPLLGPVDLTPWIGGHVGVMGYRVDPRPHWIHWVIAGGESGPGARPMHPDWVRSIRDQCQAAGVAFHFKQWGEHGPNWLNDDNGNKIEGSEWIDRMGKKAAGRTLDGRTWDEFPEPRS